MAETPGSGDHISGSVTGNVSGQVAVGKGIRQHYVAAPSAPITQAELAELHQALADVRARALGAAPPEARDAVAERLDELEEAIAAEEPDVTTMEYVKRWFVRKLPGVAGVVTSLFVHPVLGKIVQAAGDSVAAEFRRRVTEEA